MSRRNKSPKHADNLERWLLTYADLITLLMVFFIVMYASSRQDTARFNQMRSAMQKAFNVDVFVGDSGDYIETQRNTSNTEAAYAAGLMEAVIRNVSRPEIVAAQQNGGREQTIKRDIEALNNLAGASPNSGPDGGISVYRGREGIVVSLWGNTLFDSGKATVKPDATRTLDRLAGILMQMPNEIRVEGHTDNIPINTLLYPSNWELSTARATTVARYLLSRGVNGSRIGAVGYGEFRPLTDNNSRDQRARNRRVDIHIIYPDTPSVIPSIVDAERTTGAKL